MNIKFTKKGGKGDFIVSIDGVEIGTGKTVEECKKAVVAHKSGVKVEKKNGKTSK